MVSEAVSLENRLANAARAGELLDVSDETEREIPATAIRKLLFGSDAENIDPRGVRLQGAHITGELDLTDVRAAAPLMLHQCEFDESIEATRAHLPHLDLSGSRFPALDADDLVCEHDVRLRGGRCEWLSLVDANITGNLSLSDAQLIAADKPALDMEGVIIGGDFFLDEGFTASSDSYLGTLRLPGANITGQLSLREARLIATNGPALNAETLTVDSDVFLDEGFTANSDSNDGTLRLPGANITGQLSLSGAELIATNGPALNADTLTVGSSVLLDEGFTANSDSNDGTLRLPGANITGQLSLREARLTAPNGPALNADTLTVDSDVFLDEGFTANSDNNDGTVRLPRANITGQLSLSGAELIATNGPALNADTLTVGSSVLLNKGFVASSGSYLGTLRLPGANITGQLSLREARLTAPNGPALNADTLTVDSDVFLDEGFTANSDNNDGTVRLPGASVSGDLVMVLTNVGNTGENYLVLTLRGAQVSGGLGILLDGLVAESGELLRVRVDGLRYPFIPRFATYGEWLRVLRKHTVGYAAQPYQQLASVYRAAGHDREVREILIAQQRDLRRRGDLGGWFRRLLHRCSGAFIGYGHRPFRALGYLAGLCATTVGLVLLAGALGLAVRAHPNTGPCSVAESIGLGIDTAVPLLKTGGGKRCEIATTTGLGQTLYLGKYLLTILGWAFATLFVAGYTGLVRRNN
ncbi:MULTISPECIES: hypothetical protein [unclassified Actinopolyspora]|uniref:hypothetical protein n=1 Tax=unclassified Actinopolyspora TaxID=2639451 RepID=UPI0013F5C746|nr:MULTISPECIES: hypothetical protein [unclassified Actinopolyspora]NHD16405.1 hypothetical protein [Actinopolyspora sp. BKK2]NHE75732.1 hypothetical protein [Actinopolyspora sp. BKK1]